VKDALEVLAAAWTDRFRLPATEVRVGEAFPPTDVLDLDDALRRPLYFLFVRRAQQGDPVGAPIEGSVWVEARETFRGTDVVRTRFAATHAYEGDTDVAPPTKDNVRIGWLGVVEGVVRVAVDGGWARTFEMARRRRLSYRAHDLDYVVESRAAPRSSPSGRGRDGGPERRAGDPRARDPGDVGPPDLRGLLEPGLPLLLRGHGRVERGHVGAHGRPAVARVADDGERDLARVGLRRVPAADRPRVDPRGGPRGPARPAPRAPRPPVGHVRDLLRAGRPRGRGPREPGLLVAAAGVLGALRGVEMPFRQSYLVEIVGRGTLRNAVALNSIMFNLPLILGPSLAARSSRRPARRPCSCSTRSPTSRRSWLHDDPDPRRAPAPVQETVLEQILAGVRHLHGLRPARTLLALLASAMFFGWSYTSLLPAYADLLAPGDAALYGRLYSVGGVGAVLGAVWIAGRHTANPVRLVTLVLAGFALSLVAMGRGPAPPSRSRPAPPPGSA